MPGRKVGVAGRRRRGGPAGRGRGRGGMDVQPTNPPPDRRPKGYMASKKKKRGGRK